MQVTEITERIVADLDPASAEFVRANVARVREPSDEDIRRLAGLLGIRDPAPVVAPATSHR